MFQLKKAERQSVKLKLLLAGASGSGKTMSALKLARGLVSDWSKVAVIDTENSSSCLYSHLGEFQQLDFNPPFSPQRYVEAIKYCESQSNIDVIVIDSISHEWDGEGGCLEILNSFGGKFQDWNKVTPMHNKFIEAIKQCNKHIVLTSRTKSDYDMSKDDKGRAKIEKVGTKLTQREGFEYELTIALRINASHHAEVDKDRTDLFNNTVPFVIDEKIGEMISEWNISGKQVEMLDAEAKKEFINLCNGILNTIEDQKTRLEIARSCGFTKTMIFSKENCDKVYNLLCENVETIEK